MNDPKNIAAGILARGKAMYEASGAKSPICSCARVGIYQCEAHGDTNRRKEAEKVIASMGVAELCAHHSGLSEYIGQLEKRAETEKSVEVDLRNSAIKAIEQTEKERDALRGQLAEAGRERDGLRRDLCEIAKGCGVGVPDEAEAKRRIITIRAERDAAQARVGALELVLVKAKERLLFWKWIAESHGLGHQETGGVCKMIDAALATSPSSGREGGMMSPDMEREAIQAIHDQNMRDIGAAYLKGEG